ncbi:hypothetical protein PH235_12340 [Trichococcus sp. K1Tr]|uniref:hypothetical protein n=1 Tax=Trichococcus sp. K1Tr TaxID=3020847 RepID=UPI00232EEDD7|nr:hypothetical protein [Trichococcus sp. K1Tr]MDB6354351.1 hypothetical protein [Trichococcus sp. K1Tr]
MTLKVTSSLHRTTYFHLYFHDSTLIFRKQLISLGSGIIEFAGVMGAEKMNNSAESMFQETIENKKQELPRN